jgi:hypothetical protein
MFAGKGVCIPTKTYKFLVFLLKMLPSSFLSLFERKLAPGRYNEK